MNLLEVRHLKKYYETHKAVDDISFNIAAGSIFGLLGPNGAGKTTLLRMLTGIFYPDEGEILFNGQRFNPQHHIQHIGYMPEERGLYKKMKVGEQTLYLAQLKGLSKKEATEKVKYWFGKFDIHSWYHKRVDELSKGMQQKVQFISTILHQPRLLILDEPFTGLDPINSELIKQEIFELSQQGTTIIFSTHRMEQVEEICDHIMLVNKGKKVLDGAVTDIKQNFKQGLFKVGLGVMPNPAQMATWHFDIIQTHDKAFTVKLNEDSSTNDILLHFIRQDIPVIYFEEILPSITEVFIQQVKQTESANAPQPIPATPETDL
ncbi:ABC-2 type transport system ATP-binding protein [Chitinophaga terrae (ex Kim and Jung 2007)]|jgi:ABC-2 type transport system ATP-binding protein|uniref:ABC-2 type transport system ATP-binding protein n=1 Tax=Chitinophaga terrae (ex Kim and Jung 2007) TaxID=408074 RepID=A0A1H4CVN6_9BACT|nr:ABC transporter ATP-binding protein [Chitinophaga terrae (ex Kim and Jung 2007)]MDQ0105320.1 ABC-2 type transport system ATP-binding protein [Chitinophaga terrae (ex Kim and Jung 2007)]GEP90502.1 ABC transporter ATP-binding protein [Chitinophaga terrae (ex Kim and Jung 2007)]SEA64379.1 ABC-2 type transport system ATP-binding protein [Chitinophaga terrae (ex Kim and Jung 2007)]